MLLSGLGIAVVIYLAVVIAMAMYQKHLVFHPSRQDAFKLRIEPFAIVTTTTDDGLTLKGFYAPPKGKKPVIIYFHGNAGHVADRLYKTKKFLKAGYGFLLAEYRGYGGNPGEPSEEDFYKDARAWIAFAKRNGYTPGNLVYYGESLGTGVTVQMVTEQPPKAVILEAPFTSVTDVGAFYYPFLPVRLLVKYRFDSFSKVSALTMPVMVYHGTRDMTVPSRFGQKLFDAIPSTDKVLETFPKARHTNLYDYNADKKVLTFLKRYAP